MKNNNLTNKEIGRMLTPSTEITPSADLKARILSAAQEARSSQTAQPAVGNGPANGPVRSTLFADSVATKVRRLFPQVGWAVAATLAMALFITFTLRTSTPLSAARTQFKAAIGQAKGIESMVMQLGVRTEASEPIVYTDPTAEFVDCSIQVIYGDKPIWYIEKNNGRRMLNSGNGVIYEWIFDDPEGWYHEADNYTEEFASFINPTLLLKEEYRLAGKRSGAQYEVSEGPEMTTVMVTTPALGDYSESLYMLYSSIDEAPTVREYRFDSTSDQLIGLRIAFLLPDGSERTIIESHKIEYNLPLTSEMLITGEFRRTTFSDSFRTPTFNEALAGVSSDEAARTILTAMYRWDKEILNSALPYTAGMTERIKKRMRGLTILSIGKPFRSGLYAGEFVPCRVKYADGKEEDLNIALRNDNPAGIWVLDGGI